ncbi:hypothetical protein GPALN_005905 [Globodera pallida]|nr:hypothetical protein GPALN_005905 [Globodera pallida]
MRRPSVVLVLLAILGLFACCAAVGNSSSRWWKKLLTTSRQDQPEGSNTRQTTETAPTCRIYYESEPIPVSATTSNFRETVQELTGQQRQSTNFDQSHHPQHVPSYNPHMSNIPQSTNFDQSHHPQHVPPNYPDMSNIPQSTNFDQSHHPQHVPSYNPHMSNIPQSTNFTHAPSLNTVQPRTKPKRSRLSKKPQTIFIPTSMTDFKQRVQELTAMRESSTTTAGGNTQWTNPAGSANMSQNFQSQQTGGGWPNTNFFNPNHPKHS